MRFGFPIYDEKRDKAYPVWVSLTDRAQGQPTLAWNNEPLSLNKPFVNNSALNEKISEILAVYDIAFTSELNVPIVEGQVEIKQQSWGLCLVACKTFEPNGVNTDILFTGQVFEGSLRPLGTQGHIEKKIECAIDNTAILVAPIEDTNRLSGNHVITGASEDNELKYRLLDLSIQPHNGKQAANKKRSLKKLYEKRNHKILMGISGEHWRYIMAEGLDLKPRVPIAQPKEESVIFSNNTFKELLQCALPRLAKHKPLEFEKYIEHNDCERKLFKNGILDEALKKASDIFANSPVGDFPENHVLIGGSTGCGKTELAYAMLLNAVCEYDGNAIYVAPTKMLVYEAAETFRNILPDSPNAAQSPMISQKDVLVSTGEDAENDWRIANGDFKVAFIVYEKANLFLKSEQLIKRLSFVVIDELHMFSDEARGGVLDTFVTKVIDQSEKRKGQSEPVKSSQLRVLGITTEAVSTDAPLKEYFRGTGSEECVVVTAQNRPIPVTHYLQPHFGGMDYPLVKINSFTGVSSRSLEPYTLSLLKHKADEVEHTGHRTDIPEFIIKHSYGHEKVIVAGTAIGYLLQKGRDVAKTRSGYERLRNEDKAKLSEALNKSNLPSSFARLLLKNAQKGIFSHYSTLDPNVRRLMAEFFRQKDCYQGEYPDLLFATETITYGVNLPADCLILTGIEFGRQDIITGRHLQKPLSAQQFHNLTGRVGRFGHTSSSKDCKVVIVVKDMGEWNAVLNKYIGLSDCCSGGVSDEELKLASDYIEAQKENESASSQSPILLHKVSYSYFRAVLDALRYTQHEQGASVTESTVHNFLKRTFTWRSHKKRQQELSLLTSVVLKQTAYLHTTKGDIPPIVESLKDPILNEDHYSITPEGEALIDTGSKWQSIIPMRSWLKVLSKFGDKELPVELLVPGYVACEELWHTYRNFFEESDYKHASSVSQGLEVAKKLLTEELGKIPNCKAKAEALCELIDDLFDQYGGGLKLEIQAAAVNKHSRAVFYRMITALLRWIKGDELEKVNVLRHVNPEDPLEEDLIKNFSERYGQKAAWLADMCLRFFFSMDGVLSEKHARELPILAMRLRYGLPEKGLAFFKGSPMGSRLSRKEVINLLQCGADPEKIILSEHPVKLATDLAQATREQIGTSGLTVKPEKMVRNIFKYYRNSIENLCGAFCRRASYRNDWQEMPNAITTIFERCRDLNSTNSQWNEAILEFMTSFGRATEFGDLKVDHQTDGHSLRISRGEGTEILLRFCAPHTEVQTSGERNVIIVRLPWKGKKAMRGDDIEMTIFGVISLAVLLRGGFLSMRATKSWLLEANQSNKRICSHHDLLAIKSVRSKVPSEILEAMLAMDEPKGDK